MNPSLLRIKPEIHYVEQRTPQWYKLRLGIVTASETKRTYYSISPTARDAAIRRIMDVPAITKKMKETDPLYAELFNLHYTELFERAGFEIPESADRQSYRENMVAERLTGLRQDEDKYVNNAMKWGQVTEMAARNMYQLEKRSMVQDGPFYKHPALAIGASPDGIVTNRITGELGLIEIKALITRNHLYKVMKLKQVPEEFYDQIQTQLWLSGLDWCDFVAYDSRVPNGLKLFIKRVAYNENYVRTHLEPEVRLFLSQVDSDEKFFRMMIREEEERRKNPILIPKIEILL